MQFNDPIFFIFLPAFFLAWRLAAGRAALRQVLLVAASFVFYGWTGWGQLPVLLGVGFSAFLGGVLLEGQAGGGQSRRRALLALALLACAGPLGYFKYRGFLWANLGAVLAWVGLPAPLPPGWAAPGGRAPLGISFYVLQAASYLLDVYHRRLEPTHNAVHFFAYLAMFPKLLAGPIERGARLLPQLADPRTAPSEAQRWQGARLVIGGLFLKAVIADNLALYVNTAFDAPLLQSGALYWWLVLSGFAFQLYCDFSGYSAIAVGLGKWMGVELTANFNHPYLAASITEFWARWHISFSNWLRDYIFFPLSRGRDGRSRPYLGLWAAMLFSGLWHGAAWHYVLWGGCYALYTSLERLTRWPNRLKGRRGGAGLAWLLVMLQVWLAWVFFRANDTGQALTILGRLFSLSGGPALPGLDANFFVFLGLGLLYEAGGRLRFTPGFIPPALRRAGEVAFFSLLLAAAVFWRGSGNTFIYFLF